MQPQPPSGGPAQARIAVIIAAIFFVGIFPLIFMSGTGGLFSILAIVIIPVMILAGLGIYKFMETFYVTKPAVTFSPAQIKLGETVTMSYQQSFKRDTQVKKLSFQLVFRETAKYQVGTDTRTVKHELVIDEFGYAGQAYSKGHDLNDTWQFRIPENGMHTFDAGISGHNKLQWYVKVNVEIEGWLDFGKEYEVKVLPEWINT